MDKFRVGQKVRFTGLVENKSENGKISIVSAQRENIPFIDGIVRFVYQVENKYYIPEKNLEPVYDGDEPSSWSECAWQPNKAKA